MVPLKKLISSVLMFSLLATVIPGPVPEVSANEPNVAETTDETPGLPNEH